MSSTELVLFDSRDFVDNRSGGTDSSSGGGGGSKSKRGRKRRREHRRKRKRRHSRSSSDSSGDDSEDSDPTESDDDDDEDSKALSDEVEKVSVDVARENDTMLRSLARRERAPFTGEFGDNRFTPVVMSLIEEAFMMLETEPTMGIAFEFNVDSMVGGGLKFTKQGNDLKEHARDWNVRTYGKMLESTLRTGWCAGFIPWVVLPDDKYKGKPVVFNMRRNCTVLHYHNLFDEHMWVYVDKSTRNVEFSGLGVGFGGDRSKIGNKYHFLLGGTVVPNIETEVWSAPNSDGRITSKVQRLLAENVYLSVLRGCSTRAATRRSVPLTVTEESDLRRKEEASNPRRGDMDRGGDRRGVNNNRYIDQATQAIALALRTRNAAGGMDNETYKMLVQEVVSAIESKMNSSMGPRVDLENNRSYVAAQMPEEPGSYKDFVVLQMQRIMVSFGLPATLMDPKGRVTVDKSSQEAWEMHRMALKLKLLHVLRAAYDKVHHDSHLLDYLQSLPEGSDPSEEEARKATHVEITLLGIPSADVMEKLYTMGIMDFTKGFRPYLAEHHAIPIDWLKKTPDLDVQDLLTGGRGELEENKMKQADKHLKEQFEHDESMAKQAQDAALKAKKADGSGAGGKKPAKKKARTK